MVRDIRISAIGYKILCFETEGVLIWADEAQVINGLLYLYKNGGVVASFDLSKFSPVSERREQCCER
jgi:hypothetical protein